RDDHTFVRASNRRAGVAGPEKITYSASSRSAAIQRTTRPDPSSTGREKFSTGSDIRATDPPLSTAYSPVSAWNTHESRQPDRTAPGAAIRTLLSNSTGGLSDAPAPAASAPSPYTMYTPPRDSKTNPWPATPKASTGGPSGGSSRCNKLNSAWRKSFATLE